MAQGIQHSGDRGREITEGLTKSCVKKAQNKTTGGHWLVSDHTGPRSLMRWLETIGFGVGNQGKELEITMRKVVVH